MRIARKADAPGVARPEIPTHLLDPGGRIPYGPNRLWQLLAYLDEVDPANRWHDSLVLLSQSGDVLADVLTPAPEPTPRAYRLAAEEAEAA
jgi:hypothetical protein